LNNFEETFIIKVFSSHKINQKSYIPFVVQNKCAA